MKWKGPIEFAQSSEMMASLFHLRDKNCRNSSMIDNNSRLFLELCEGGGVTNSYPGFAPIWSKNSILAPSAPT